MKCAAGDVAREMRDWFAGRSRSAPYGIRFVCGTVVDAHLRERSVTETPKPPASFEDWMMLGRVGGAGALAGMPVEVDKTLPGDVWKLTRQTTILLEDADYTTRHLVVCEGMLTEGAPTALEREYWLVDFCGMYAMTSYGYEQMARRKFAWYVGACGHDIKPSELQLKFGAYDGRLGLTSVQVLASVPREPVRYPQCGDWLCGDEADWTEADPADEPAIFAGAVAEKRYLDKMLGGEGLPDRWAYPPEIWREALQHRRRCADGKPLWTIDVRPAASP
jgi:hypothetical protein